MTDLVAADSDTAARPAFARALFAARFTRGEAVADDAVMARCAEEVGLQPAPLLAAQDERPLQERVVLGMIRGVEQVGLFGVPLVTHRGERYWGNDRVEWWLRQLDDARGAPVPDLCADPLSPAHFMR